MFGNRAQPPIKSLIAEGIIIDGNIRFTEGLRIDGRVTGSVTAPLHRLGRDVFTTRPGGGAMAPSALRYRRNCHG